MNMKLGALILTGRQFSIEFALNLFFFFFHLFVFYLDFSCGSALQMLEEVQL